MDVSVRTEDGRSRAGGSLPRPEPTVATGVSRECWESWTWQLQNRVRSAAALAHYVNPTADETRAITALADRFRFVITPYYAALMDPDDPECPIRRQVVPRCAELDDPAGRSDPLDEVAHSPVKNVIRVYPDRIFRRAGWLALRSIPTA